MGATRRSGYTWEEVMLSMDIRNEAEAERQQQQDVLDKQNSEQTAMSAWSLGLSVLGGALFGPAGYAAGKIVGRGIGDLQYDWEDDAEALDTGKFYKTEGEDFKNLKKAEAKDQTSGQIVQGVTDLATMYVQAGGLQEGPTDLTTFGSGDDAWTVFGEADTSGVLQATNYGTSGFKIPFTDRVLPVARTLPGDQSLFSSWEKGAGLLKNIKPIGKKLKSANTGVNSLKGYYESYLASKEEKAAS